MYMPKIEKSDSTAVSYYALPVIYTCTGTHVVKVSRTSIGIQVITSVGKCVILLCNTLVTTQHTLTFCCNFEIRGLRALQCIIVKVVDMFGIQQLHLLYQALMRGRIFAGGHTHNPIRRFFFALLMMYLALQNFLMLFLIGKFPP